MYVTLDDWIDTISGEYLRDYVTQGGAAVKFAVAPTVELRRRVGRGIARAAEEAACQVAVLDSAAVKLHQVEQIFFSVARQIDWDGLARTVVRRLLTAEGFVLPPPGDSLDYREIAARNDYLEGELRHDVRILLTNHVSRDVRMAQEFRIAMVRLCQAQLDPSEAVRGEAVAVKQWLRGELRLITALKPALIFQRIARHNARDLLLSLAHWLRATGDGGPQGLVLVLDVGRYLVDRRPPAGSGDSALFYSTTAVLDAYEVLRQFIDATDDLEGCLIVVLAPAEFLDDPKRGLERYDPLKLRIWDEVRDRHRANPLAALVRLTDDGAGGAAIDRDDLPDTADWSPTE